MLTLLGIQCLLVSKCMHVDFLVYTPFGVLQNTENATIVHIGSGHKRNNYTVVGREASGCPPIPPCLDSAKFTNVVLCASYYFHVTSNSHSAFLPKGLLARQNWTFPRKIQYIVNLSYKKLFIVSLTLVYSTLATIILFLFMTIYILCGCIKGRMRKGIVFSSKAHNC